MKTKKLQELLGTSALKYRKKPYFWLFFLHFIHFPVSFGPKMVKKIPIDIRLLFWCVYFASKVKFWLYFFKKKSIDVLISEQKIGLSAHCAQACQSAHSAQLTPLEKKACTALPSNSIHPKRGHFFYNLRTSIVYTLK